MEKTSMTKWVATILILLALAAAGFAFSLLKPGSSEPEPFGGAVPGDMEPLPAKVDEEVAEAVREELGATPESMPADKEEVREELSKPPEGGGLSEEEKARIREELRK